MSKQHNLRIVNTIFISICALSLLSVSLMAFINPQSVMNLVAVSLTNTDAFSSIRGVYGGAGMSMVLLLIYLTRYQQSIALLFLMWLWGLYAISRFITIFVEGPLGTFGLQWIITETVLFLIASVLFILNKRQHVCA